MTESMDRRIFMGNFFKSFIRSAAKIKEEINYVIEESNETDFSFSSEIPRVLLEQEAKRLKLDPDKDNEIILKILKKEMEALKS